jgi:ABC-type sugar transport system permease subunit
MSTTLPVTQGPVAVRTRARLEPSERRRLARRYRWRRYLVALGFIAPSLVFFSVFLLWPTIQVAYQTLYTGGILGDLRYVGLDNWTKLPSNAIAIRSLTNSVTFSLLVVPAMIIIGLGLGMLLVGIRRGGASFRALLYFPTLAPVVVASLIWLFVVHPDFGAFNLGLRLVGGQPLNWLGTPELALPTLAALDVWRGIGFWALFFLATLVALPQELYAAAHLDGANGWQRFRYLTIPLIRGPLLFALVIATIYTLQVFDSVFVLTDGSPAGATQTLVWYIYKALFQFDNIGLGATLSMLLLTFILILTLILMRLLRARGTT